MTKMRSAYAVALIESTAHDSVSQKQAIIRDFAKAKDSNGYCTTVGPMAIPGAIIVPMNATDTGGLSGYVLGVNPETGELWGNFPQTYSMVGLIVCAMRLSKTWEEAFWRDS